MKKFWRKATAVVATVAMVCSVGMPAFAAEEFISIDEYAAAIKAEGTKYGIDCEVIDYDPSKKITQEMLDNAIMNINVFALESQIINVDNLSSIMTLESSEKQNNVTRNMPVTKTVQKSFSVVHPPYGSATIRADVNVTIDAQRDYVITVNSIDVHEAGGSVNLDYWLTTNTSVIKNAPSTGYITLHVDGRIRFSYTEPTTGITTAYTYDESHDLDIDCR